MVILILTTQGYRELEFRWAMNGEVSDKSWCLLTPIA